MVKLRPGRSVQLEDSQSWKLCMRQKLVESMVHSEIPSKFCERCLKDLKGLSHEMDLDLMTSMVSFRPK